MRNRTLISKWLSKDRKVMSVSTAFKVHYNQKLGDLSGHLGGNAPWPLGDRYPCGPIRTCGIVRLSSVPWSPSDRVRETKKTESEENIMPSSVSATYVSEGTRLVVNFLNAPRSSSCYSVQGRIQELPLGRGASPPSPPLLLLSPFPSPPLPSLRSRTP